jgi:membrane associated rhomboid family serine protease
MRTLEIIVGLMVALLAFVALKLLGLLIKFAVIAAIVGFVIGLLVARAFRSKSS